MLGGTEARFPGLALRRIGHSRFSNSVNSVISRAA
jgi:hypothetical protein